MESSNNNIVYSNVRPQQTDGSSKPVRNLSMTMRSQFRLHSSRVLRVNNANTRSPYQAAVTLNPMTSSLPSMASSSNRITQASLNPLAVIASEASIAADLALKKQRLMKRTSELT